MKKRRILYPATTDNITVEEALEPLRRMDSNGDAAPHGPSIRKRSGAAASGSRTVARRVVRRMKKK